MRFSEPHHKVFLIRQDTSYARAMERRRASRSSRTTIRELAEYTGLSPAAVSYALRGMQVSAETERRVREAAEELGYEADRGPRAERGGQGGDALVVGGKQRLCLALGQRLDAERDRRGHQGALEAVGGHQRRAAVGIVVGEVHGRLGLADQAQRPPCGGAQHHGRLAALGERAQQRLGPEMLVDVDWAAQIVDGDAVQ